MNMKLKNIITAAVAFAAMSLGISCMNNTDSPVTEVEETPEASDATDTGCQYNSRSAEPGSQTPAIVLTKEGDNISCELINHSANCGVSYFDINTEYIKGKGHPDSLFVDVNPVIPREMDCTCPYSVYFTIRNVKAESFYLYCDWYAGMVSFKESSQVTIERQLKEVTIDGSKYRLLLPGEVAELKSMVECKGELRVPSTINYDGKNYKVMMLDYSALWHLPEVTKVILPKSIRSIVGTFSTNILLLDPSLETVEVEEGSSLFSSIDGILYSSNGKMLYCYPAGNKRTSYTVPDGVEKIGKDAFASNQNLKTVRFPESVVTMGRGVFSECTSLESIYLPFKLDKIEFDGIDYFVFDNIKSSPTIYVLESEMENIKVLYKGPVLPL